MDAWFGSGNTWPWIQGFLARRQFIASLSSGPENSHCSEQGQLLLSWGIWCPVLPGDFLVATKTWAPSDKMTGGLAGSPTSSSPGRRLGRREEGGKGAGRGWLALRMRVRAELCFVAASMARTGSKRLRNLAGAWQARRFLFQLVVGWPTALRN